MGKAQRSLVGTQLRMFHCLTEKAFENITIETREGNIAFIQLNRPKALNALCHSLYEDLAEALKKVDLCPDTRVVVLTGSEKAFAAGADIKEMKDLTFPDTYSQDFLGWWYAIPQTKKPIVGAINGYALGGGCELAMMCDVLIAGENAKFGQPEINIGTVPGMGGSQRLTRAIGKSRAMEMCLTGDFMDAAEAAQRGLVSRVVKSDQTVEEAMKVARKIASKSLPASIICKELVNQSFETSLQQGLLYERRMF